MASGFFVNEMISRAQCDVASVERQKNKRMTLRNYGNI